MSLKGCWNWSVDVKPFAQKMLLWKAERLGIDLVERGALEAMDTVLRDILTTSVEDIYAEFRKLDMQERTEFLRRIKVPGEELCPDRVTQPISPEMVKANAEASTWPRAERERMVQDLDLR